MMSLKDRISQWVSFFETENLKEFILELDERSFMILGIATAVLVIVFLIKRWIRSAVAVLALCATIVLLHFAIPPEGQEISFEQLVELFVGGAVIVGTTIYFMFIKSD
jgi:hypothetical protein